MQWVDIHGAQVHPVVLIDSVWGVYHYPKVYNYLLCCCVRALEMYFRDAFLTRHRG